MNSKIVDREEQGSQVLSVRLTTKQFQRLQKTLRNFGINQGSMSDQLRLFFKEAHMISLRRKRKLREPQVKIHEEDPLTGSLAVQDQEEEEAYEEWFNSLASYSDEEPL
jgi:hypothetical protein